MKRPQALLAIAFSLLATLRAGGPGPALAGSDTRLTRGQVVERDAAAGETHPYTVELGAGEYLQVLVEQHGADVVQTLTAPDGSVVLETDCPSQFIGPDPLAAIAAQDGVYSLTLKVEAVATPPRGGYEIRLEAIREPSAQDLVRVKAVQAGAEAKRLFRQNPRVALDHFRTALRAWEEVGDRRMQMWTELVVGVLHAQGMDDFKGAIEHYRRSLATALELGDEWAEARARYNLGQSLRKTGELEEGKENLERALALHRGAGRQDAVARTLSALGAFFDLAAEPRQALDALFEALSIFQALGNKRSEAATRTDLGHAYLRLRDPELALEQYRRALPAFEREPPFRAATLAHIAQAQFQMGDLAEARKAYTEVLGLHKTLGNKIYEADAYLGLGDVHQVENDLAGAAELFVSALPVYRARGYPLGEGLAQCRLGEVRRRLADLGAARAAFEAALAIAPRAGPLVSGCAEAGLARVARDAGDLDAARAHGEAALHRAESLRGRVLGHHARAAALASQQSVYELMIDVLMRQHAGDRSAGRDAAAFEVSEAARARSLLEMLAEGHVDVRRGVDPELLAEERSLRGAINAKAQDEAQALAAGSLERAEALGRDVDGLLARLAETEARVRRRSPEYAALTQPHPLTLPEVREQVLDPDTQLLQYSLGELRSYLWVVSSGRLESFVLAPRTEIELAARRAHGLVSMPAATADGQQAAAAGEAALRELTRLLLTPAASALTAKRLLVVAPGALQYVPFASLPLPEGDSALSSAGLPTATPRPAPLVSRFEVVSAPSASVIATLRRDSSERGRPNKAVAVFADPVFETSDPRVAAVGTRPRVTPAVAVLEGASRRVEPHGALERALAGMRGSGQGLGRLPFSRREADAIIALAGPRQAFLATGFEATRTAATSPQIADYRVVHFATHGLLDTRRPELSGLVLSLLDRAGHPDDGFLRLHDVYNLKLSADLVVLSGCQTALGKEMGGEGLVGLTRGFMYAGARRVVASLWQVDDESTAELMRGFYRAMLTDGTRPSEALRAAQLEMSRDRRWAAPFHWAGFVLQGEWR